MKYNWNAKYIRYLLKDLDVKAELNDILDKDEILEEDENDIIFKYDKDMEDYNFLYPLLKNNIKYINTLVSDVHSDFININQSFNYVNSFYNQIDTELKEIYLYCSNKKNRIKICNSNKFYLGRTFFSNKVNEHFIKLNKENDFHDSIALVHEYGHTLSYYYNSLFKSSHIDSDYVEFEGIFMELVFYDFIKNNTDNKEFAIILKKYLNLYFNNMISIAYYNLILNNSYNLFINKYNFSYDNFINTIALNENIDIDNLKKYINYYNVDVFRITISFLIAFEVYYIYQNNKEEGWNLYKKIISNEFFFSPEDQFHEIKKMGIKPFSHIDNFINDNEKVLKR